jgi:hypothetical protein
MAFELLFWFFLLWFLLIRIFFSITIIFSSLNMWLWSCIFGLCEFGRFDALSRILNYINFYIIGIGSLKSFGIISVRTVTFTTDFLSVLVDGIFFRIFWKPDHAFSFFG